MMQTINLTVSEQPQTIADDERCEYEFLNDDLIFKPKEKNTKFSHFHSVTVPARTMNVLYDTYICPHNIFTLSDNQFLYRCQFILVLTSLFRLKVKFTNQT